ncbi:helix-turn-helix domain-containing protein [Bradyrhizobium sp. 172]|uniref:helix-turn-helix domain-containing protein n=1 Tax=Bradyrhizobium sp. 172 TaxID=2782643 RepID=UPI001FFED9E7|nr:helix-turn-helix domain-containing protein [Bradyrhizobium sp. 172]UPJ99465.1 DNA-binding protein [Bradyrhizobium sp. 172]
MTKLADDLMIGAKPIATELGVPLRQAFYLLETGKIPGFKIGAKWAARKSTLKAFVDNLERKREFPCTFCF